MLGESVDDHEPGAEEVRESDEEEGKEAVAVDGEGDDGGVDGGVDPRPEVDLREPVSGMKVLSSGVILPAVCRGGSS